MESLVFFNESIWGTQEAMVWHGKGTPKVCSSTRKDYINAIINI